MVIDMNESQLNTVAQLRVFLEGTLEVEFRPLHQDDPQRYAFIAALVKRYRAPAHAFVRKLTPADVALLAETDALHGTLSGPATVHLLRRAYRVYGQSRYQRLAGLSVSHLYNLCRSRGYQAKRVLSRPAVSEARLSLTPGGLVCYQLKTP
jgi:hypothetical protein